MADLAVGAASDELVILLHGHDAAPVAAEHAARPDREGKAERGTTTPIQNVAGAAGRKRPSRTPLRQRRRPEQPRRDAERNDMSGARKRRTRGAGLLGAARRDEPVHGPRRSRARRSRFAPRGSSRTEASRGIGRDRVEIGDAAVRDPSGQRAGARASSVVCMPAARAASSSSAMSERNRISPAGTPIASAMRRYERASRFGPVSVSK